MVSLLIKLFVEIPYQWNTVTQPIIATSPFSSFVVPAPGMGVSRLTMSYTDGHDAEKNKQFKCHARSLRAIKKNNTFAASCYGPSLRNNYNQGTLETSFIHRQSGYFISI